MNLKTMMMAACLLAMSGCSLGAATRGVNSGPDGRGGSDPSGGARAQTFGGLCAALSYRGTPLHEWAAMPAGAAPAMGACTWQQSDSQPYRVRLNALTQNPRPHGNQAVAAVVDLRGKVLVTFGPAASFEVARASGVEFDTRGKADRFRQFTKFPQDGNMDLMLEVRCLQEPCAIGQAGFDAAVP